MTDTDRLIADVREIARFFDFTATRVGDPGSPVRKDAAEKRETARKAAETIAALVEEKDVRVEQYELACARIQALEGGVRLSLATFRRYEELHAAKGSVDGDAKARANGQIADNLASLLKDTQP